MQKFLLSVCCFTLISTLANAKRDFYVESEINCDLEKMCYEKESDTPLNGKLRIYYHTGVIKTEIEYKNGLRNGVLSRFYPDGKQSSYAIYQNNLLNGGASTYYNNTGNIETEVYYVNGILNGNHKAYYEDGTIKLEGSYFNDKKHGHERQYDKKGKVINEITYNEGTPISAICKDINGKRINYTNKAQQYINQNTTPCVTSLNSR